MNEITGINGFIKKIIALYPASFKGDQFIINTWSETAVSLLYSPKIDYAKLFEIVVANNPNKNFAPDFPWILEESKKCYAKEAKNVSRGLHIKVYNPVYKAVLNDVFPAGTSEEQMIKAYEKKFPNTTGWEIVGYV